MALDQPPPKMPSQQAQTVPAWTVPPIAFLVPVACFWAFTQRNNRPRAELYRLIISLGIAMLLTGAVTNCLKLAFSRPRPNFIAACWGNSDPVFEGGSGSTYGGYPQCTSSTSSYAENLKSFPSGHSSMSASGLGFLTYYLLGQLKVYSGGGLAWRVVLSCIPALVAIAIGITRVTDYWCVCLGCVICVPVVLLGGHWQHPGNRLLVRVPRVCRVCASDVAGGYHSVAVEGPCVKSHPCVCHHSHPPPWLLLKASPAYSACQPTSVLPLCATIPSSLVPLKGITLLPHSTQRHHPSPSFPLKASPI